ncbi:hypothetical protein LT493_36230 [Streptomyces tricolor]|nr:hypothetical protein [Streptomyces tricolor]
MPIRSTASGCTTRSLSRCGRQALIANLSVLGSSTGAVFADPGAPAAGRRSGTGTAAEGQHMAILLVYEEGHGWSATQFNAEQPELPWSAFRLPHPRGEAGAFRVAARSAAPAADVLLTRTSRPLHLPVRAVRRGRAPALAVGARCPGHRHPAARRRHGHGDGSARLPRAGARPVVLAHARRLGVRVRQRPLRTRRCRTAPGGRLHPDPARVPGGRGQRPGDAVARRAHDPGTSAAQSAGRGQRQPGPWPGGDGAAAGGPAGHPAHGRGAPAGC